MVLDVSCMDTNEDRTSADGDTDIFCLPEYQEDIHNYLREAELQCRPKVLPLLSQYGCLFDCSSIL